MNAFLLKNKRKTLGMECCLLCSRVFGLPPFLWMRSGQFVLFPFLWDCQNIDDDKYPVDDKVHSPSHVFKDPSAGTWYVLPYVKKPHGYVNSECCKQREGSNQTDQAYPVEKKKDDNRKFNSGQEVNQHICKWTREWLKVKLSTEFFNICQFTACSVGK